jgi:hypothetical protein
MKSKYPTNFAARWVFRNPGTDVSSARGLMRFYGVGACWGGGCRGATVAVANTTICACVWGGGCCFNALCVFSFYFVCMVLLPALGLDLFGGLARTFYSAGSLAVSMDQAYRCISSNTSSLHRVCACLSHRLYPFLGFLRRKALGAYVVDLFLPFYCRKALEAYEIRIQTGFECVDSEKHSRIINQAHHELMLIAKFILLN